MTDNSDDKIRQPKRTLLEMAKAVSKYAEESKGGKTIILSDFAKAIGVNSQTASMWLDVVHMFQEQTPKMSREKVARFTTIKFDYLSPNKALEQEFRNNNRNLFG